MCVPQIVTQGAYDQDQTYFTGHAEKMFCEEFFSNFVCESMTYICFKENNNVKITVKYTVTDILQMHDQGFAALLLYLWEYSHFLALWICFK